MQQIEILFRVFEFVILIFSLCFHEAAHAWMASRLGDQTARMLGRITLNPKYHVDPIGTLLIPGIGIFGPLVGLGFLSGVLIGWARPTPISSRNFRRIVRDENLVSLAGPVSNLILVLIAICLLLVVAHTVPGGRQIVLLSFDWQLIEGIGPVLQSVVLLAVLAIYVNLSLFFFNLLPIPPLDGSHLVRNMLPPGAVRVYDSIGGMLSWFLMIAVGGTILRILINPALAIVASILMHG